jgi:hypothetical protein
VSKIESATSEPTAWVVTCKQPQRGEVFEITLVSSDAYPGEEALEGQLGNCSAGLQGYASMSKVQNMTFHDSVGDVACALWIVEVRLPEQRVPK